MYCYWSDLVSKPGTPGQVAGLLVTAALLPLPGNPCLPVLWGGKWTTATKAKPGLSWKSQCCWPALQTEVMQPAAQQPGLKESAAGGVFSPGCAEHLTQHL